MQARKGDYRLIKHIIRCARKIKSKNTMPVVTTVRVDGAVDRITTGLRRSLKAARAVCLCAAEVGVLCSSVVVWVVMGGWCVDSEQCCGGRCWGVCCLVRSLCWCVGAAQAVDVTLFHTSLSQHNKLTSPTCRRLSAQQKDRQQLACLLADLLSIHACALLTFI